MNANSPIESALGPAVAESYEDILAAQSGPKSAGDYLNALHQALNKTRLPFFPSRCRTGMCTGVGGEFIADPD